MNENLSAGEQCFRIIREHEKGPVNRPGVRLTPDGAALDAYLCPANKWTIGFGCRYRPDGTPIVAGDTITPEQVDEYLAAALRRVESSVRDVVTVELKQHQFDAICSWVYNLGVKALINSSDLLNAINSRRWEDAAVEMGKYIYTSSARKNDKVWYRVLFGLFLRRNQEGCVILGFDWPNAVRAGDMDLDFNTVWEPEKDRFYDKVTSKTSFVEVLRVAQHYPLPESPEPTQAIQPLPAPMEQAGTKAAVAPVSDSGKPTSELVLTKDMQQPAAPNASAAKEGGAASPQPMPSPSSPLSKPDQKPSNSNGQVSATPGGQSAAPSLPAPAPLPKLDPPKPPPEPALPPPSDALPADLADPKDMLLSRRFWGLFITGFSTLNFLPRGVQEWMGSQNNRELLSWLVLVIVGVVIFQIGKKKAKRPLK